MVIYSLMVLAFALFQFDDNPVGRGGMNETMRDNGRLMCWLVGEGYN